MLSDRERQTLRELEHSLRSEDPGFARSFDARAQRLPDNCHGGVGMQVLLVAGLLVGAFMLVVGSLVGAIAIVTCTGLIWLAWRFAADLPEQSA